MSHSVKGPAARILPHLREAGLILGEARRDYYPRSVIADDEWRELDRLLEELHDYHRIARRSLGVRG
jgi:hypothetical protein